MAFFPIRQFYFRLYQTNFFADFFIFSKKLENFSGIMNDLSAIFWYLNTRQEENKLKSNTC